MSTYEQNVHIVELRHVRKTFATGDGSPDRRFVALEDVDLRVPGGQFVAVVGKSGSGKSTLLNLIAGIDRPSRGEVLVAGACVHELGESSLARWRGRNVGVVFQFFQLLPTLTVLENVLLPMDFCGTLPRAKARARGLELLDSVGIADQAHKLPSALSGGQQQRAAIARALANDPRLLVADEPTGNLDTQTAAAIFELLLAQKRAGKSILIVTHERDVRRFVDRIVTLSDGKVVSDEAGEGHA